MNNRPSRLLLLSGVLLATLSFWGKTTLLADPPTQGLSFRLSFDDGLKSTFGAQPDPASQKGTPLCVPGKNGQALREGAGDSYLLYRAE